MHVNNTLNPKADLCKNFAGLYGIRSPEKAAEKMASKSHARHSCKFLLLPLAASVLRVTMVLFSLSQ